MMYIWAVWLGDRFRPLGKGRGGGGLLLKVEFLCLEAKLQIVFDQINNFRQMLLDLVHLGSLKFVQNCCVNLSREVGLHMCELGCVWGRGEKSTVSLAAWSSEDGK